MSLLTSQQVTTFRMLLDATDANHANYLCRNNMMNINAIKMTKYEMFKTQNLDAVIAVYRNYQNVMVVFQKKTEKWTKRTQITNCGMCKPDVLSTIWSRYKLIMDESTHCKKDEGMEERNQMIETREVCVTTGIQSGSWLTEVADKRQ